MFNLSRMSLSLFIFGIAVLLIGNVMAGDKYEKEKAVLPQIGSPMSVTILPPKISKSLKLTRIPTSEPIPLLIGSGWHCQPTPIGTERCTPYIVFCTDDQSVCGCTSACP
jgi:hypothetical protein